MAIKIGPGKPGTGPQGIVPAPGRPGEIAWEAAPTRLERKAVYMEIYGDTGTGRTSLALSAPGPIALIHCAEKLEGVVQRYSKEKEIRLYNFGAVFKPGLPKDIAQQADLVWRGLIKAWYDAYGWARTIILDTHTDAWELIRLARFGGLKPEGGRVDANYGPVNAEFTGPFKFFRTQNTTNLIVIAKTKDEYVKAKGKDGMGERTGRTIVAGMKDVGFMADVRIRTDRDITQNLFTGTIIKGWMNGPLEGTELENEMLNFPTVLNLITETEDWG